MHDLEAFNLEIKVEKPPVWEEAHKHFKIVDEATVYTYGDILYNPANITIDILLMEHEKTHAAQQKAYEGGPEAWWRRYFEDVEFKNDQDFEAYWNQYRLFCTLVKSIDKRFMYRWKLAGEFTGAIPGKPYGRVQICTMLKTAIHK